MAPLAFPYDRFSDPTQEDGDSLDRQGALHEAWSKKHQVPLFLAERLQDKGVSAFGSLNSTGSPDRYALAKFMKWIEEGKVRPGDFLLIENFDRLSRDEEVPACHLLTSILMARVRVVQLSPDELTLTEKSDAFEIFRAVLELSRGHRESAVKSQRLISLWGKRREAARRGTGILTRQLPAWVTVADGRLTLIEERAAVLRRIIELSLAGYGCGAILRRFNEERVPAFLAPTPREPGRKGKKREAFSGRWNRTYISNFLKDRRALGEFQPRRGRRAGRVIEGEVIPNYFPAVMTAEEWHALRAVARKRRNCPGRTGSHVNPFKGLLRNARDGQPYYVTSRIKKDARGQNPIKHRVLTGASSLLGQSSCYSFPYPVFEDAILSLLDEVDPGEVLATGKGPDEVLSLSGELGQVKAKIAELEEELMEGPIAALARTLRKLELRQRELAERLTEAQQRAAHPLSEAWGEAQSLLEAFHKATDPADARRRLHGALQRIMEGAWVLVVPRGRDRLAAVQIWFAGGEACRDYLILHRPPKGDRSGTTPGGWWATTLTSLGPRGLDLRRLEDTRRLEAALESLDLRTVTDLAPGQSR